MLLFTDIFRSLLRPSLLCDTLMIVAEATEIWPWIDRWEGSMIHKRCIFLRVKSKQHVLAIYGHHQVLCQLYGHHQVLCQLRFHYINCMNCVMMWRSLHRIFVEIYLSIGRYYVHTPGWDPCTTGGTLNISLA